MSHCYFSDSAYQLTAPDTQPLPLFVVERARGDAWKDSLTDMQQAMLGNSDTALKDGAYGTLFDTAGHIAGAYLVLGQDVIWQAAAAAASLPARLYQPDWTFADDALGEPLALGFALASYQARLAPDESARDNIANLTSSSYSQEQLALFEGVSFCRDLINAPANIMTPARLAEEARALASHYGATFEVTEGEALAAQYPAIHTVGRAAEIGPRLIDMSWGSKGPLITLVGKGITFDSGGLDLKPSKAMEMMKKDMGGAAHILGLTAAIMKAGLPVRLRILIAAAENAVSEKSMRPMDVIDTAAGIKVEVGNTDAEGRLVLADALHLACQEEPDFLLDFATLTGAARVALGTECPALFCNRQETATALMHHGCAEDDPLWQLPLFEAYERFLDAGHMALSSTGQSGYGGAITAALFLRRFTGRTVNWAHIDVMAWNLSSRAGRPRGGEAMGLRACFAYIKSLAK